MSLVFFFETSHGFMAIRITRDSLQTMDRSNKLDTVKQQVQERFSNSYLGAGKLVESGLRKSQENYMQEEPTAAIRIDGIQKWREREINGKKELIYFDTAIKLIEESLKTWLDSVREGNEPLVKGSIPTIEEFYFPRKSRLIQQAPSKPISALDVGAVIFTLSEDGKTATVQAAFGPNQNPPDPTLVASVEYELYLNEETGSWERKI